MSKRPLRLCQYVVGTVIVLATLRQLMLRGGWQDTPFTVDQGVDVTYILSSREVIEVKEMFYSDVLLESDLRHQGLYALWAREDNDHKKYVTQRGVCDGYFAYNHTVGNNLAVNRDIWDTRPKDCRTLFQELDYDTLPSVSVVIPFHNEPLASILRTIYSVINRSPKQVLKEIILVDDGSTEDMVCIKEELEKAVYVIDHRIKVIRTVQREGSTKARIIGASYATGDIISYIDSHVEVNVKWMEPFLVAIKNNPKTAVMSQLDNINTDDLSIWKTYTGSHGGFNWNFEFYWKAMPDRISKIRSRESDPIPTPIMPAGAFALNRKFYTSIGLYDPDMKIWGVDDVEFSFRLWQCGGRAEIQPCSRVAHIFRSRIPYSFLDDSRKVIYHNSVRAAETTFGKYKKFFFAQADQKQVVVNMTSVRERIQMKERLKCHNFDWYMANVIPEMPFPPDDAEYYENIMVDSNKDKGCITYEKGTFMVTDCVMLKREQFFYLNTISQLIYFPNKKCVIVSNHRLVLGDCVKSQWIFYDKWNARQLSPRQISPDDKEMCVQLLSDKQLSTAPCDMNNQNQKWGFTYKFDWNKPLSYET